VIRIDEVLVPDYILPFYKKTIQEVQAGQPAFDILVTLSSLKTRSPHIPPLLPGTAAPPAVMDDVSLILPPSDGIPSSEEGAESAATLNDDNDHGENVADGEHSNNAYVQPKPSQEDIALALLASILADIFHEMHKVCRTISELHALHKQFARAFSDTMLVPDKNDKAHVMSYLKAKGLTWEKVRLSSPGWLWKRVRRYIPEKNFLYQILKEFFNCWGPVKCIVTGQPLFSGETWKKAEAVLHDVRMGWISDPACIPLYTVLRYDKWGLAIYHCIRGTNSVEGAVHNPIRRSFAAMNASVELADCLVADFRHRHNLDVGTVNKTGAQYLGHYDTWLDHDITRLRADIHWKSKPAACLSIQDTDPLDFPQTEEQFGITCIPSTTRLQHDFNGPCATSPNDELQDSSLSISRIYPLKLHLSKLKGKRNDIYTYLANAQKTLFAVTPIHTKNEIKLFNDSVKNGGPFCVSSGQPNFYQMATWWSSKADGKNIFYKLPEHLSAYYKTWQKHGQATQSMIASEPQRRSNERRIHSAQHIAQVLDAAPINKPGVAVSQDSHNAIEHRERDSDQPDSGEIEMVDATDLPSPDLAPPVPEQLVEQEGTSQPHMSTTPNADLPYYSPAPFVGSFEMAPAVIRDPSSQSSSALFLMSTGQSMERKPRHCSVCKAAGRDGRNCPGRGNKKKCTFANRKCD